MPPNPEHLSTAGRLLLDRRRFLSGSATTLGSLAFADLLARHLPDDPEPEPITRPPDPARGGPQSAESQAGGHGAPTGGKQSETKTSTGGDNRQQCKVCAGWLTKSGRCNKRACPTNRGRMVR